MQGVKILPADAAHADAACHVLRRSIAELCGPDYANDPAVMAEWLGSKTPANLGEWIADRENYSIAASHNGTIVGFALLRANEILLNYVLPEYVGQGVGHQMLEQLEQHALSRGFRELHCTSTITARNFYISHGFQKFGKAIYVGGMAGEFPLRKRLVT